MRLARLPVLTVSAAFLLLVLLICIGMGEVQIDMANFGKVWDEYIAAPTSDNALNVYAMLPDGRDMEIRLQVEVRPLISSSLNVLESQIFSGERNALKVAFRLFTIADSALKEGLARIIGNLIRFNARLFLQELKNHYELIDLSFIVCSFQFSLAGDIPGQELEKKARIKALEYVEDADLSDLQKECIKSLKKCKTI
jgi:hypothetical protein